MAFFSRRLKITCNVKISVENIFCYFYIMSENAFRVVQVEKKMVTGFSRQSCNKKTNWPYQLYFQVYREHFPGSKVTIKKRSGTAVFLFAVTKLPKGKPQRFQVSHSLRENKLNMIHYEMVPKDILSESDKIRI